MRKAPYSDELNANQLANLQEIITTGDPKQEGDWITYISNNQLNGQLRLVDVKISTPPSEKSVYEAKECNDTYRDASQHYLSQGCPRQSQIDILGAKACHVLQRRDVVSTCRTKVIELAAENLQRRVASIMPAILRPSHAPFANACAFRCQFTLLGRNCSKFTNL